MTAKIISIGNSKGIRIPNAVLRALKIESEVDLIINEERREILLCPKRKSREGWDHDFKKMHSNKDDELIIDESVDLNNADWKW